MWPAIIAYLKRATGIGYKPVPPRQERPEIIRLAEATALLNKTIEEVRQLNKQYEDGLSQRLSDIENNLRR